MLIIIDLSEKKTFKTGAYLALQTIYRVFNVRTSSTSICVVLLKVLFFFVFFLSTFPVTLKTETDKGFLNYN